MTNHPSGVNMAAFLDQQVLDRPTKRAVVVPCGRDARGRVASTQVTFRQLHDEVNALARGLKRIGITRGTRTALMVSPSHEFFALTFALWKVGATLILIDPGVGLPNLKKCLAEAQPEAFVGVTKAHAARVLLRWAPDTIKICVTVGRRLFWGGYTLDDIRITDGDPVPTELLPPDEMAAVMFTSGSTGIAKGAVYTHGILTHQVRFIQELYGFRPEDVDLATFPLFALFDVCLGMTVLVPDMDATKPAQADPVKLMESINDHGATVMFGSPALVDTLSRYGAARNLKLPTLRTVISCGAPARNEVLARLHRMLPDDAEIFTPYGATESLPVSSIGSRAILGETAEETTRGGGTCVGKPIPQVTVAIIRITDEPIAVWSDDLRLPDGEIGEIVVSGPIVTRDYYRRPEATKLAKIASADGITIFHRMGDVGRLDAQGRLWFCGRKAHRVETANGPLFTIPVERVFNQHPRVFRTALVGVGPIGRKKPVLCVELESTGSSDQPRPTGSTGPAGAIDEAALRRELLDLGKAHPHTAGITDFLIHPGFPVDVRHNAKIGREQLALWAAGQLP